MECVHQTINNSRFRNILTMTRYTRARISVFLVYLGKCPIKTRKSKKRKKKNELARSRAHHITCEDRIFEVSCAKSKG
ncbi:MAG: hypothetical protein ACI8RD_009432 [Bacillariaceae sp.]|jgi:hypothetical protein